MEELTIDREFDAVCDPLSAEELSLLEKQLLADGCLDPIITWAMHDDTILDGKHRYLLCRKHGIPFKTKALRIETRAEAVAWIAMKQLGRRNVPLAKRALLAARLVNTSHGGVNSQNCELIDREKAAEIGGVSPRTIDDAKKINESGAAALVEAVKAKDVSISTAAALAELPKAEQKKIVAKGADAAKAAAKKVKAADKPKEYKDSFDTPKLDKELKRDKKPGSVKKQWEDSDFVDAIGRFGKSIDAAHTDLLRLVADCEANCKSANSDVARTQRAIHQFKTESHKLLRGITDAFRLWRPTR